MVKWILIQAYILDNHMHIEMSLNTGMDGFHFKIISFTDMHERTSTNCVCV